MKKYIYMSRAYVKPMKSLVTAHWTELFHCNNFMKRHCWNWKLSDLFTLTFKEVTSPFREQFGFNLCQVWKLLMNTDFYGQSHPLSNFLFQQVLAGLHRAYVLELSSKWHYHYLCGHKPCIHAFDSFCNANISLHHAVCPCYMSFPLGRWGLRHLLDS